MANRPHAIITGASSGIGAVYADRLAARGHDLTLVARRTDRLAVLAETLRISHQCRVNVLAADLSDNAGITRVEEVLDGADATSFLLNCAGSGALGPTREVSAEAIDAMLNLNVVALTRLSIAAGRRFAAKGSGTIVNIGSVLAVMTPASASAYAGSKSYVLTFTRSLAAELAPAGVQVQAVLPGPVLTEFFGDGPVPFPAHLMMTAEHLVDAALAGLDAGEEVTFPNLPDVAQWTDFERARVALVGAISQTGQPASRYRV